MGIKERQERDRETVRRAILDSARELFVTEGYGNVSIRKVAERVEYSPAALYSYFPSKDDIFFALADEGFSLLRNSAPGERDLAARPPLERVRASVWRLYEFSCDHPQYFALMFVDRSVPRISRSDECFEAARALKDEFVGHIEACVRAGELPATLHPMVAVRVLTAGLTGLAMMRLSARLGDGEDADALARDILDVTIAGLQADRPLRTNRLPCPLDVRAETPAS